MLKKLLMAGAIAAMATGVSAQSFFGNLEGVMEGENRLNLNLVRAEQEGVVQIERLNGELLGMTRVREGANSNVLVTLGGTGAMTDLIAKLVVGGEVKDVARIQVSE